MFNILRFIGWFVAFFSFPLYYKSTRGFKFKIATLELYHGKVTRNGVPRYQDHQKRAVRVERNDIIKISWPTGLIDDWSSPATGGDDGPVLMWSSTGEEHSWPTCVVVQRRQRLPTGKAEERKGGERREKERALIDWGCHVEEMRERGREKKFQKKKRKKKKKKTRWDKMGTCGKLWLGCFKLKIHYL